MTVINVCDKVVLARKYPAVMAAECVPLEAQTQRFAALSHKTKLRINETQNIASQITQLYGGILGPQVAPPLRAPMGGHRHVVSGNESAAVWHASVGSTSKSTACGVPMIVPQVTWPC